MKNVSIDRESSVLDMEKSFNGMKRILLGGILFSLTATLGWTYRQEPIFLGEVGMFDDLSVLAHKDSVYTSVTWVTSKAGNLFQMRYFKRHQGEVCLSPSWDEYAELAKKDPRLAHLVPQGAPPPSGPPGPHWPYPGWTPNPGTLTRTALNLIFPMGVLLNSRLMAEGLEGALAAGDTAENAYRYTRPRILVIGLGPGTGISMLAHHFPRASIVAVDIDPVVVDMARSYYPFLDWLTSQKTDDGLPRLELLAEDGRQYIRYQASRAAAKHPYDLVILDAYGAGGSIPSHLMTKEFYASCASILGDDGILMSNTIGAYTRADGPGPSKNTRNKHLVFGGAMRSMRAAGLREAYNLPVNKIVARGPRAFRPDQVNNNITMASKAPLGPDTNPEGWARARAFVPYPELPLSTYVARFVALYDAEKRPISSKADFLPMEKADPSLRAKFTIMPDQHGHVSNYESSDPAVIEQVRKFVREHHVGERAPAGWDRDGARHVAIQQVDDVAYAREAYQSTLELANDPSLHSGAALVGPLEAERHGRPACIIPDAPLFTDARPNADIFNN
jgi:hypothetical protein